MEHISTLKMELKPQGGLAFKESSACFYGPFMQGVMMEHVATDYAAYLHQLPFNPYSQSLTAKDEGLLEWRLNALTDQAAEHILTPLSKASSFDVRKMDARLEVTCITTESIPLTALTGRIQDDGEQRSHIEFITPAAFKSAGSYINIPSVRLLFQNLLMRYSQVYGADAEADADTVAYIDEHVRISSYSLKSRHFENVARNGGRIPAFAGAINLKAQGPQPLLGLVRMLVGFAEYSGVGIKTSMGMGAVHCK